MSNMNIGEIQPTLLTSNECEDGAFPFSVTTILKDNVSDIPSKTNVGDDNNHNDNNHNDLTVYTTDYSQDFFRRKAYLTVSSQLHLEATVCGTGRDGYCMTTAFRAEPSKGPLHLAEFCMPEWELIDCGLDGNMKVAETAIKYCIDRVLTECIDEIEYLDNYIITELKGDKQRMLSEHKQKRSNMKKSDWINEKKINSI